METLILVILFMIPISTVTGTVIKRMKGKTIL